MTAEVAVINRIGVGLAADSAVTLDFGGTGNKVYTSADKLFLLANNAPVGVMMYGNAYFLDVPWETVIKLYRRQLSTRVFDHLHEYLNDFLSFLQLQDAILSEESQLRLLRETSLRVFQLIQTNLEGRLDKAIQKHHELTPNDITNEFDEFVSELLSKVIQNDCVEGISEDFQDSLQERYEAEIALARDQIFGELPRREKTNTNLIRIVCEFLTRRLPIGTESGFVVAGFGELEHFPRLIEVEFRGMVANTPLYCKSQSIEIGNEHKAIIVPFAQGEMVHTFMEGIDPQLWNLISQSTLGLFKGLSNEIVAKVSEADPELGKKLKSELEPEIDNVLQRLLQEWVKRRKMDYVDPVMDIASALPKDELGAMAEALVNLTKFKRRVSRQLETVGGPIDVAVITKGDGFVWIKRKHYFSPELNPRFLFKYTQRRSTA